MMSKQNILDVQLTNFAPVFIPTLNRYTHLKECIDSLAKCTHADKTELYISVDYPPSKEYVEGYRKVKQYLSTPIHGFKDVTIFWQENNLGIYENPLFLRQYAFEHFDRMIYTEDDMIFAPSFLDYVNKCLEYWKDDDSVLAVIEGGDIEADSYNTVYRIPCLAGGATAEWNDKFKKYLNDINYEYLEGIILNPEKRKKLRLYNQDTFYNLVLFCYNKQPFWYYADGKTVAAIDFVCEIYAIIENKYGITTGEAISKNRGYDGTGAHCMKDEVRQLKNEQTMLKKEPTFEFIYNKEEDDVDKYMENLAKHRKISWRRLLYSDFWAWMYRTFGERSRGLFEVIWNLMREFGRLKRMIKRGFEK